MLAGRGGKSIYGDRFEVGAASADQAYLIELQGRWC